MQPSDLLAQLKIEPVLIDVGASAETPAVWNEIAARSIYIGFDPDLRDVREISEGKFHRSVTINEAVTDRKNAEYVTFYLTSSPYCSSALKPDMAALEQYAFYGYFRVECETQVKATTLDQVLERFSLPRIDWIKIDSQGTDLRLLHSINDKTRSGILAADLEPGLIDAYQGEDMFAQVHEEMIKSGFWLSRMQVKGTARISKTTQEALTKEGITGPSLLAGAVRASPGWAEVRYFRTLESLAAREAALEDYLRLWIFALADDQTGFALNIAQEYAKIFGQDDISQILWEKALLRVREAERQLQVRKRLSSRILRKIARVIGGT